MLNRISACDINSTAHSLELYALREWQKFLHHMLTNVHDSMRTFQIFLVLTRGRDAKHWTMRALSPFIYCSLRTTSVALSRRFEMIIRDLFTQDIVGFDPFHTEPHDYIFWRIDGHFCKRLSIRIVLPPKHIYFVKRCIRLQFSEQNLFHSRLLCHLISLPGAAPYPNLGLGNHSQHLSNWIVT